MSNLYFGEREFGLKPRTENEIDAICNLIK